MKKFDVRKRLIGFLILFVLSAGCVSREQLLPSPPPVDRTSTSTPSTGTPTNSPTPLPSRTIAFTSSPEQTAPPAVTKTSQCVPTVDAILASKVIHLWWDSSGKILYYIRENREGGMYDPATKNVTLGLHLTPEPGDWTKEPPRELRDLIPQSVENTSIHMAPSQTRAIYIVNRYTQPTLTPQAMGESDTPEFLEDLLFVDTSSRTIKPIGRIEGQIGSILWSKDETKAFVDMIGVLGEAQFWFIDLTQFSITPLIPVQYYEGDFNLWDVVLNGNAILYQNHDGIWMRDLNGNETELPEEVTPHYWWLTETDILFLISETGKEYHPAIYNIEKNIFTNKTDFTFTISYTFGTTVALSPDHLKLGYADAKGYLNLLRLCKEDISVN